MLRTIIIFFGPAGSGKGTQSEMLSEYLKLPTISTGALLRREQRSGSAFGKQIKALMAQGKLVDIASMAKILKKRLAKKDVKKGFMLDGYPRTLEQLRHTFKLIKKSDRLYFVIIELSDQEVLRRLAGRRACVCGETYHIIYNKPRRPNICDVCGKKLFRRIDDTPKTIKARLKDYKQRTKLMFKPAAKRGQLIFVDGAKGINNIQEEIRLKLKKEGITKSK